MKLVKFHVKQKKWHSIAQVFYKIKLRNYY